MPKSILYARRSPRPRHALERNESIETQLEIGKRYLADKGFEIYGEPIIDDDRSGRTPLAKREGGKRLLELAPRVGNVACSSLDRIFRDNIDGQQTLAKWSGSNVLLHAISDGAP